MSDNILKSGLHCPECGDYSVIKYLNEGDTLYKCTHEYCNHFDMDAKGEGEQISAQFTRHLLGQVTELKQKVDELKLEIEILRIYGNKDCKAQADERLAELHKLGVYSVDKLDSL